MDKLDRELMKIELHDHINRADDKELELMYFMWLNNEFSKFEWWKDDELMAELDRRSAALKSGEDNGVPWEEVMGKLSNRQKK